MTQDVPETPQRSHEEEVTLPELIAREVLAHPAVVRLDGGAYGTVATPLPGKKVVGVRLAPAGEHVEVAVVLRLGTPLPEIVTQLRHVVRAAAGDVVVDVTVSDVETGRVEPGDVETGTG